MNNNENKTENDSANHDAVENSSKVLSSQVFSSRVFIHVGYPKSASTTLQKHLFDKHPQINSLSTYPTGNVGTDSLEINPECAFLSDRQLRDFYYQLTTLDPIDYAKHAPEDLYKHLFAQYVDSDKVALDKVTLLSSERFTDVLFSYDSIQDKALRLKQIFPHAKIILVLRNQFNIIASQYRDHPFNPRCVRIGRPVSINRWVEIALQDPLVKYANSLNYYETAKCYADLFGKENVGIFLFEEMVTDLARYANRLSEFMGIDPDQTALCLGGKHENLTVSHRYNVYRKLVRRGLPNIETISFLPQSVQRLALNYLQQGPKKKHSLNPEMTALVQRYFSEPNRKLRDEFNVNVSDYNYPLLCE